MLLSNNRLMDEAGGDGGAGGGAGNAGNDANGAANWRDSLPADLKNEPSLADIKDVPGLAKSYISAQRMVGADKIVLPGKDADQPTWNAFFQRLGRPEKPDGYDFSKIQLPDGAKLDNTFSDAFKNSAHEIGLSKSQAERMFNWYLTDLQQTSSILEKKYNESKEAVLTGLRKEFGNTVDQEIEAAKFVIQQLGGDELKQALDDTGAGDDPRVIKAFINIRKRMSEDSLSPAFRNNSGNMTPADAQRRIAELQSDKAYMTRSDPRHKDVIEEITNLTAQAHPEEAKVIAVDKMGFGR